MIISRGRVIHSQANRAFIVSRSTKPILRWGCPSPLAILDAGGGRERRKEDGLLRVESAERRANPWMELDHPRPRSLNQARHGKPPISPADTTEQMEIHTDCF